MVLLGFSFFRIVIHIYLARKDSKVCTIIGAGPVNKACFQGIMAAAPALETVAIYDVFEAASEKFAAWAKETYGLETIIAASTEEAVRLGDIVSVAASRLKPVIILDEWVKEGSTMIFTGASRVDEKYWQNCKLFFDNVKMHSAYMEDAHRDKVSPAEVYRGMMAGVIYEMIEAGKLPGLESFPNLGEVVCGKIVGRANDSERIALMTGGMITEDIAWAYDLYERAKEMGLGQNLLLWEEPHWS